MFSSNTDSLGYQSFKGASWALVSGLHLGDTIKGLSLVLGPLFNPDVRACILGLRAYYFKPNHLFLFKNRKLFREGSYKNSLSYFQVQSQK